MDFSLSDEERDIRQWVRDFVNTQLIPLEQEALQRERKNLVAVPHTQIEELQALARSAGFFGLQTPTEYGGMNLSAVMTTLVYQELGRTFIPFKFAGEADNILYSARPEQQQRYLLPTIEGEKKSCFAITEPGAGSDAKAITTTARKQGDNWIITGEKTFITGGHEADYVMVFAVTDKDKAASAGVSCFLVDRDQGWTSSPIDTMGQWGPASLHFDEVVVPDSAMLGERGRGLELAMKWIGKGRYLLPARAIGACERMMSMSLEHSRTRTTFGQPLSDRQAIQWMLADSATELEAARLLVLSAAWQVDQAMDSTCAQSMAKLFGGEKCNQIVDRMLQIHGGMGYTRELPIERWYRELRLLRIYEGTDEMQRRTIARHLLTGKTSPHGFLG